MRIAYCGPISLRALQDYLPASEALPEGYRYPLGADFVRSLIERGHFVSVISCAYDISEPCVIRGENLELRLVPRRRPRRFIWDLYGKERRAMQQQLQESKPEIVHAQWTYEFASAAIESGLPYVVTARDYPPAIFAHTRQLYRFYRLLYSFYIIPKCRVLVANSPYLADKIEKFYGKPSRAVIPNGITSDFKLRKSYDGCEQYDFNVTLVANWDRRKNVATALQAFALAQKECPIMKLHLFGAGLGPEEGAARYAKVHDLCSGLTFHGYQSPDHIRRFHIEQTDVLLHPSLEESFGMTILEAMVFGIPVVGGQESGAVPWVVGEGGYLIDIRNSKAIAQKLVHLSCNQAELMYLGRKAQEHARAKFTMTVVVDAYLDLYQDIINEIN